MAVATLLAGLAFVLHPLDPDHIEKSLSHTTESLTRALSNSASDLAKRLRQPDPPKSGLVLPSNISNDNRSLLSSEYLREQLQEFVESRPDPLAYYRSVKHTLMWYRVFAHALRFVYFAAITWESVLVLWIFMCDNLKIAWVPVCAPDTCIYVSGVILAFGLLILFSVIILSTALSTLTRRISE